MSYVQEIFFHTKLSFDILQILFFDQNYLIDFQNLDL